MNILDNPIKEIITIKNFDGDFVGSKGVLHDIINPATNEVIGKVPDTRPEEIDAIIAKASRAFQEWRQTSPLIRVRYLFKLKELLEENFEELSRIQTVEHGKTIDESRGETRRGIENIEAACAATTLMMGHNLEDVSNGIDEHCIYQPLGVFAAITPYNFPFMVPLWFAPYAVATGNCIIIKPSPKDPISQYKIAELVLEAGLPEGVWNIVNGFNNATNRLLDHPDIKGIGFVGSTNVAKYIYENCGKFGKRVVAQGGAKNFILVMPDSDLNKVIPALLTSFFGNAGQRCLAAGNALVVGDDKFYNRFIKMFIEATKKITIGYGLDNDVQMGPMQNIEAKKRVLQYIDLGIEEGAKLELDGRKFSVKGNLSDACFIGPTIFSEVLPTMRIAREEIFGPVANIMKVDNFERAVEIINASNYGNAASIFTNSGSLAREFRYNVSCGNIGVNIGVPAPVGLFHFGGMKDSFFGALHAQGRDIIRFFLEGKIVIERWF